MSVYKNIDSRAVGSGYNFFILSGGSLKHDIRQDIYKCHYEHDDPGNDNDLDTRYLLLIVVFLPI